MAFIARQLDQRVRKTAAGVIESDCLVGFAFQVARKNKVFLGLAHCSLETFPIFASCLFTLSLFTLSCLFQNNISLVCELLSSFGILYNVGCLESR